MAKSKKSKAAAKVEVADVKNTEQEETVDQSAPATEEKLEETTTSEAATSDATTTEEAASETTTESADVKPAEKEVAVEEVDESIAYVKDTFAVYAKQMAPGVAVDDGIVRRNQIALLNAFNTTLRNADTFDQNMKFILKTIRDGRKGIFSDAYAFRGFNSLRLSPAQYKRFESLFTLFIAAADVGAPKKVGKLIDINIVSRYLNDDDERSLVFSFFTAG